MFKTKEEFKYEFSRRIIESYGRTVEESHITEKFMTLERMVRDYASVNWAMTKMATRTNYQKQVHYFSMEFLIGRLLVNNMMNLGIYEIAKEGLADYGVNIHDLEELESDAGLGNGGLGRLAACFMDSLASLSYPAFGNTIRYEYGLFKQKIENGYQVEVPDQWLRLGNMWEVRKPKHAVDVKFWGRVVWNEETGKWDHIDAECVKAVPYDMPIVGNDTTVTNTLRLWSSEPSDEIPSNKDFRQYAQEVRDICQTLYPDDSTLAGRTLRLKQQYFFVSAGLRAIIKNHLRVYPSLANFHEKNVIQLNDTHPVLVIPELMRILIDEYDMDWDEAWDITTQTCAYTNHTILSEALEKWPISTMQALLPRVYQIIEEINRRFIGYVKHISDNDEDLLNRVMILKDGQVHMAHLAIVGSFSVNGVARLHTQILMEQEMKDFYLYFGGTDNTDFMSNLYPLDNLIPLSESSWEFVLSEFPREVIDKYIVFAESPATDPLCIDKDNYEVVLFSHDPIKCGKVYNNFNDYLKNEIISTQELLGELEFDEGEKKSYMTKLLPGENIDFEFRHEKLE